MRDAEVEIVEVINRRKKEEPSEKLEESKLIDTSNRGAFLPRVALLCILLFFASASIVFSYKAKSMTWLPNDLTNRVQSTTKVNRSSFQPTQCNSTNSESNIKQTNYCKSQCRPPGSEQLPKGIVKETSNFEMRTLGGDVVRKENANSPKILLAIPVGIRQKEVVNQIVKKFISSCDCTVVLFHYDGFVDEWKDLEWSKIAIHISIANQTKWWFAKRFLHPDIVDDYDYIFLWDEDLDVENFHPKRYLEIIKREGLEISQPAVDPEKSEIHQAITIRSKKGDVHRWAEKLVGKKCSENSTGPPCAGWIEIMAPVFSRAAWRCMWYMIQNDLIHGWALDWNSGYCAQGDRSKNVGVVDSEYIVHKGFSTLGRADDTKISVDDPSSKEKMAVKARSFFEMEELIRRWREAVVEDKCWTDPYAEPTTQRSG